MVSVYCASVNIHIMNPEYRQTGVLWTLVNDKTTQAGWEDRFAHLVSCLIKFCQPAPAVSFPTVFIESVNEWNFSNGLVTAKLQPNHLAEKQARDVKLALQKAASGRNGDQTLLETVEFLPKMTEANKQELYLLKRTFGHRNRTCANARLSFGQFIYEETSFHQTPPVLEDFSRADIRLDIRQVCSRRTLGFSLKQDETKKHSTARTIYLDCIWTCDVFSEDVCFGKGKMSPPAVETEEMMSSSSLYAVAYKTLVLHNSMHLKTKPDIVQLRFVDEGPGASETDHVFWKIAVDLEELLCRERVVDEIGFSSSS